MIMVYGLKNCDTCRKAIRALTAASIAHQFFDIRADGLEPATIKSWLKQIDASALTNTRSTTWRGLDEKTRARCDQDALGVLCEHPTLIKRPVIDHKGTITIGWTPAVQSSLGL